MTRALGLMSAQGIARPVKQPPSYETDFYSWAVDQARLLREGRLSEADLPNIVEEIEGLARSEYSSLVSFLARIIQHLLKWDHQPLRRSRSWKNSINAHQVQAELCLRDNPGLKGRLDEIMSDAYRLAVAYAMDETGFKREIFPEVSPYDFETVMTRKVAE